jgi:2-polyprenyl-3-methyl-5-hydroxy-6-metoxy-1,4-benzoquinol methylase
MISPLEEVYTKYNTARLSRESGPKATGGLLERERGELFAGWIGTGKTVLDIGCFDGALAQYYLEGNTVTGFDVDREVLKRCPPGMRTEAHDLNGDWHLGYESAFDVVVASEVIEHLYYPRQVMEKLAYVLKPGGMLVGSVPNAFNLKNRVRLLRAQPQDTPLGEPTHINHFSYAMLEKLLKEKFEDVRIEGVVQQKWKWFSDITPGLGSFILAFRAEVKDKK